MPGLAKTPEELTAANVAASTIESVGIFVGPALGGVLVATAGVEATFAASAGLLVWSAALIGAVDEPAKRADPEDDEEGDAASDSCARPRRGFARSSPTGGSTVLTGLFAAQTFVDGALGVLVVVLALETLDLGASGVGYLNSVLGVGGIVGGVAAAALVARSRLGPDFGARDRPLGGAARPDRDLARPARCDRRPRGRRSGEHDRGRLGRHVAAACGSRRGARARVRCDGERDPRCGRARVRLGAGRRRPRRRPLGARRASARCCRCSRCSPGARLRGWIAPGPRRSVELLRVAPALRAAAAGDARVSRRAARPEALRGGGDDRDAQASSGDAFFVIAEGTVEVAPVGGLGPAARAGRALRRDRAAARRPSHGDRGRDDRRRAARAAGRGVRGRRQRQRGRAPGRRCSRRRAARAGLGRARPIASPG